MKRNILIILTVLIFIAVITFSYQRNTSTNSKLDSTSLVANSSTNSSNIEPASTNASFGNTNSNPGNVAMPVWATQMSSINENLNLTRDQKIRELLRLLNKSINEPQASQAILQSLSRYNPIEAIDTILPYLNNADEAIQNSALTALNNSMLLTTDEFKAKKSNPEFDRLRAQIPTAVDKLYDSENTSENLKKAIISGYLTTNNTPENNRKMTQEILQQKILNDNTAAYMANVLMESTTDTKVLLAQIATLPNFEQEKIIAGLGNNISNNSEILSVLNQQQKQQLKNYILEHPPESRNEPEKANQMDSWNNTVNSL